MKVLNFNFYALWQGIYTWSLRAGRAAARPVLLMWLVMTSKSTPTKDKWAIFASLAYLVLPIDLLSAKRLPILGWLDEVVSLSLLIRKMAQHITPEIEARADAQLDAWFPAAPATPSTGQAI